MKLQSKSTVLLFAGVFSAAIASAEARLDTRGYSASAYELESGDLLYIEKHVETWRQGKLVGRSVVYEDPDGNLIARKKVDYGPNPATPSFELTDFRIGLSESAEVKGNSVGLFSGEVEDREGVKEVSLPEGAVIDAGFDAFTRENFGRILSGDQFEFLFAVPSAQRFFKFQLVPMGSYDYKGESAVRVQMRPANRLLRLLVDPIDLVYARDGRLLEFRGISNVWNNEGDRYKTRIVFDYEADSAPPLVARISG